MKPKYVLKNSQGKVILLNNLEQKIANLNQKKVNDLGFNVDITTLTTIMKKVTEQKFFEIAPAKYLPVRVGEGQWADQLTTYRSYELGDDFSNGLINTGGGDARLAGAGAGVDAVNVKVKNWAKKIGWTIFELQQAAKAGNWDVVTSLEKSRKRNWDLGIQRTAFLGLSGVSGVLGLFNQAGITDNTTRITKKISAMTSAELKVLVANLLNDYRVNCNRTAWPNRFVLPESDYIGLASQSSADFPIKSVKKVLEEAFAEITGKEDFKILPCAYADPGSGLNVHATKYYYALYNAEEESIRMDIPVDYTNTLANTIDNFSFQNVGYGQFTGVMAYRPLELMYFSWS